MVVMIEMGRLDDTGDKYVQRDIKIDRMYFKYRTYILSVLYML